MNCVFHIKIFHLEVYDTKGCDENVHAFFTEVLLLFIFGSFSEVNCRDCALDLRIHEYLN